MVLNQKSIFDVRAMQYRFRNVRPGDRIIFAPATLYDRYAAPLYASAADEYEVCRLVDDLVACGAGLVFNRRVRLVNAVYPTSCIVREFLAVRPETIHRLTAALARVPIGTPCELEPAI